MCPAASLASTTGSNRSTTTAPAAAACEICARASGCRLPQTTSVGGCTTWRRPACLRCRADGRADHRRSAGENHAVDSRATGGRCRRSSHRPPASATAMPSGSPEPRRDRTACRRARATVTPSGAQRVGRPRDPTGPRGRRRRPGPRARDDRRASPPRRCTTRPSAGRAGTSSTGCPVAAMAGHQLGGPVAAQGRVDLVCEPAVRADRRRSFGGLGGGEVRDARSTTVDAACGG